MPQPLFGFTWQRPVNRDGYALQEGLCPLNRSRPRWDAYETAERSRSRVRATDYEPVLVESSGAEFERYLPLAEETGLFRTFSDLEATPERCLSFANRYGWLEVGAFYDEPDMQHIERVAAWRMRVLWLRHLVHLWDLARAGNETALSDFIEWDGDRVTFRLLPADRPLFPMAFEEYIAADERKTNSITFDASEKNSDLHTVLHARGVIKPALFFCLAAVTGELRGMEHQSLVSVGMLWDLEQDRPMIQFQPQTLWGAILFQFAQAIDGNRQFQRCPVCKKWFELSPGVNRANKLTCSGSCRTRWYRQRRERTLELHTQAKTLREIVRETGAKPENVKRWIQEFKDQQKRKG